MITTVKGPRPAARVVSNPRGKAHTYTSQWHTSPSYYRYGEENSRIHRAPPAWGRWKFDEVLHRKTPVKPLQVYATIGGRRFLSPSPP